MQRRQREPGSSGQRPAISSVGAAFPKALAAGPALWELPRTHPAARRAAPHPQLLLSLGARWATQQLIFAFLEIGMRNELPEEFGNEEMERQFGASS